MIVHLWGLSSGEAGRWGDGETRRDGDGDVDEHHDHAPIIVGVSCSGRSCVPVPKL